MHGESHSPSIVRRPGCKLQNANMRLLCLPPAGGNASTFYPMLSLDSTDLEICPITLPGREDRFKENIPDSLTVLAKQIAPQLAHLLDRPYLIFGYSMGAILAWELIKQWRLNELDEPLALYTLGARAPHVGYHDDKLLHALPSSEFRSELKKLGGMPSELIDNAEVMDILEPILRTDLRNCETYEATAAPPIKGFVHSYISTEDPLVSINDAKAWSEYSSGNFTLHQLTGPHIVSAEILVNIGSEIIENIRSDI